MFAMLWDRTSTVLQSRWPPVAATVVLLILLAWKLAQLTWAIVTPVDTPGFAPPAPRQEASVQEQAAGHTKMLHIIGSLFGEPRSETQDGKTPPPQTLPKTNLNLTLTGTVLNGHASLAIINVDKGADTVFTLGQEITPGVTLAEVYPTRVAIRHAGKLEILALPDWSLHDAADSYSNETAPPEGILRKPLPTRPMRRDWNDILRRRMEAARQ